MTHLFSRGALSRGVVSVALAVLGTGCAPLATARLEYRSTRWTAPNSSSEAAEIELVVAATTDTHGRLRSWDYYANAAEPQRGLTRLATIVDSLRNANLGRVVLVDAGDLLQGNPLTYVAARTASASLRPHPVA